MSKSKRKTFEDIILDILKKNPEAHLPFDVLQDILQVNSKKDNNKLKGAINSLYDRDLIIKKRGGGIQLSPNGNKSSSGGITGKLDVSRRGTGYLITEEFEEIGRAHV